ncbi:hypothetical protein KR018_001738 [Drosophila ironensis]|nr:hypothetical protein KR018_001738 [Drosophila ironensis]
MRQQKAPYTPEIKHPTDTFNFDPIDPEKLWSNDFNMSSGDDIDLNELRADLTESASNSRMNFTEEYFEVKSKIDRAIKKVRVDSVLSSTSIRFPGEQTSSARIATRSSRLPRLGGAYMEWPGFYPMVNIMDGGGSATL